MLIPTSFGKLPEPQGCYNGQIVMGTTLGQISSALAQLAHVKTLGEAHYQVSHSLYGSNGFASNIGGTIFTEVTDIYKLDREYNFLYQSTQLSTRLAVLFNYSAYSDSLTPNVKIILRDTASNSYSGTILDNGVEFEIDLHLQTNRQDLDPRSAFTGCELIDAPVSSGYDFPRPLYVPLAKRGELLNIQFLTTAVALSSVHIYDVYEPEVTP